MDLITSSPPAKAHSDTVPLAHIGAYVRLVRPANLVTAAADVIAGYLVAGGGSDALGWLIGASVCLYAGGVVLNDYFDRDLDSVERPERPLPQGLVSARAAAVLGVLLLSSGVAAAFYASTITGVIAVCIAMAVLLYDAVAKEQSIGPVVMGTCRALNLLMGLTVAPALLGHTWLWMLLPLAYIGGLTLLSRDEVFGGSRTGSAAMLGVLSFVVVGITVMQGVSVERWLRVFPFIALLLLKVVPPLWRAYRRPEAIQIRAAVHAGVVSLIVLDAAIAAGSAGVVLGAAIVSLSVVAMELGRIFPVT